MNLFTVYMFMLSLYTSDCVHQSSCSEVENNPLTNFESGVCLKFEKNVGLTSQAIKKEQLAFQRIVNKYVQRCREFPYGIEDEDEFNKSVKTNLRDTGYMDKYDLRIKNLDCPSITEISDQGSCNSCWAVAATDVMTDRLCLKSNGTNKNRFSVMDLLSCCKECLTNQNQPCAAGGMVKRAWLYLTHIGIVSGHYNQADRIGCRNYHVSPCTHDYSKARNETTNKCAVPTMSCPSVKNEPTCNEQKCDKAWDGQSYKEDRMKANESYCIKRRFSKDEAEIKLEILLNGPVHAVMSVYEDFYTMFTPNYDNFHEVKPYRHKFEDKNYCLAHSIRIVGWGKTTKNRSYWIVANSYGEKWGDRGFFHLDFDHDNTYKEKPVGKEIVYAGIPKL